MNKMKKLSIKTIFRLLEKLQALKRSLKNIIPLFISGFIHPISGNRLLRDFQRKFFIVRRWHVLLAVFSIFKLLRRLSKFISIATYKEARSLRQAMKNATSCEEWTDSAVKLDSIEGRTLPALTRRLASLEKSTHHLRALRRSEDVHGLMWRLRQDSSRSVGSLLSDAAEQRRVHCIVPPPEVVEYIKETERSLHFVCHFPELSLDERLSFINELRHAYGRTALVLSGGGSFGHFHFGIARELLQQGLLPRVVSGSSAGAIGCAMMATRTDEELATTIDDWIHQKETDFFGKDKTAIALVKHLFQKGTLHAHEEFVLRLQRLFGNLTFQQAHARTGRILNICVVAYDNKEPSRLLNYLTAPHVLIWSAVACSSAFPFLFAPQELLALSPSGGIIPHHHGGGVMEAVHGGSVSMQRRWCDGSLEEDLPMRGLSEMFNVNYFLVSQCNPYLVPIVAFRSIFPRVVQRLGEWEFKHRLKQLLAFWPDSRLLKLLSQPWDGDLNFVLPWNTFSLLQSAKNFTPQEILLAMKHGQHCIWSKIAAVKASCAIEYAIDAELRSLSLQSKALVRREENMVLYARSSIPSWFDLKSLGMEINAEENNNDNDDNSHPVSSSTNSERDGAFALEHGMDAWRDLAALTAMGYDGSLDFVAV